MKTLYVTNLGLLDNLAKTQVLPYLEGLAGGGINVMILSFEKKDNLKKTEELAKMRARLDKEGIKWHILTYHNRWGNMLDIIRGRLKVLSIIFKEEIDVLHARSSIPIIMVWPLAKVFRKKIVYDRRGTMSGDFIDDVNVKNMFSMGFMNKLLDGLDDFLMRHSDAVIVLSQRSRDILRNAKGMGDKIIEAIPCCADMAAFDVKKTEDPDLQGRFVLCYLGSLGTCYLLPEMAGFFKALKKEKPDAVFYIISHTDRKYIESVLNREGVEIPDFKIMEAAPEDVPSFLKQCDLSIMFIKQVACKIGSSPTKFGESLAAGVPVVVNKEIGDTEDIIRECGIGVIVDELNEGGYAKASRAALKLINENGRLKEQCAECAKKYFALEKGIEKYRGVYSKLYRL